MPSTYEQENRSGSSLGWNGTDRNKDPVTNFGTVLGHGMGANSLGYTQGQNSQAELAAAQGFGDTAARAASLTAPALNYGSSNASLFTAGQYATPQFADQNVALAENYRVANGGMSPAARQQMQAVDSGIGQQYSLAGSALGGSLGQAAAMRSAAQGAAGMQVQGYNQAAMTQAQAQDVARQQYSNQVTAMRNQNTAGMGQMADIAGAQATNANNMASYEAQRRGLADQAELYGQGIAQQMNQSNYSAQQQQADMFLRNEQQLQSNSQTAKDRAAKIASASISAGTSVIGNMMTSDERAKIPVSLGQAAEMRLWR